MCERHLCTATLTIFRKNDLTRQNVLFQLPINVVTEELLSSYSVISVVTEDRNTVTYQRIAFPTARVYLSRSPTSLPEHRTGRTQSSSL